MKTATLCLEEIVVCLEMVNFRYSDIHVNFSHCSASKTTFAVI